MIQTLDSAHSRRWAQLLTCAHSWDNTIDLLASTFHVYAVDLRFHGESDKPAWGFHVARLAADLHDFLQAAKITSPVLLGSSLGCAIIWSYVELYGDTHLSKLVFVDQAPSQWKMPDWEHCSKGIYDVPSLANIQRAVSALPPKIEQPERAAKRLNAPDSDDSLRHSQTPPTHEVTHPPTQWTWMRSRTATPSAASRIHWHPSFRRS